MADKLTFELVSPERLLLSEEVEMVTVPGTEGEFGVLAHHAPVMTALRPGMIRIVGGTDNRDVFVWGGFAEVNEKGLTILAEEAQMIEDVDWGQVAQRIKNLEEDVADYEDLEKKEEARDRLWHIQQMYDAAQRA
jgi:F-type H+-transporting ATPase subunit epsilon